MPERPEKPRYTYAEAETALASTTGIQAKDQRGGLRGRLKHFQRLGLVELKPVGRRRVLYSYVQVAQWLIALILADTGLDPTLIVAGLKQNWKHIAPALELATSLEAQSGRPVYLLLWPRTMRASWEGKSPFALNTTQLDLTPPQSFGFPPRQNELLQLVHDNPDTWFCAYNLTRALSRLKNALPQRS